MKKGVEKLFTWTKKTSWLSQQFG